MTRVATASIVAAREAATWLALTVFIFAIVVSTVSPAQF
jgi:hypothetical protein